jgi:DinB family protein
MIEFNIEDAILFLARTPAVLNDLLDNLPPSWIYANEGADTWSPYDIVGHLIHGEKTDWIPRMEIILNQDTDKNFRPFDRFAQFRESDGKSLPELLEEFSQVRKTNIEKLSMIAFERNDMQKTGTHPAFGKVNLKELLSSWVVHDLNHIGQVCRVMANQYKVEIGPWVEYMGILHWGGSAGRQKPKEIK